MPSEPSSRDEDRALDEALARLTREQLLSVLRSHAAALPAWDRERLIEQMNRSADAPRSATRSTNQGVVGPMLFGMLGIAIATAVALFYLMSVRTRPAAVEAPSPVPSAATDAMPVAPDSW